MMFDGPRLVPCEFIRGNAYRTLLSASRYRCRPSATCTVVAENHGRYLDVVDWFRVPLDSYSFRLAV